MLRRMNLFHRIALPALALSLLCRRANGVEETTPNRDFLEVRGTALYLHSKPFNEISFNKFDLFWQILAAECGRKGFGENPVASAEKALKELHGFGFKTIRVFCNSSREYFDLEKRPLFFAAMDRMLDLCDKYDIRIVFSLGNCEKSFAEKCKEPFADMIARADSKSRSMARGYVRDVVMRYRNRKIIAMWEHGNELLLMADIGGKTRIWNKIAIPSLEEIARFHTEEAAFIRSLDSNHPITTGDSYRNSIWHGYQFGKGTGKDMWGMDTMDDIARGVSMAQKGVDVFCIHNYYHSAVFGCHPVMGANGKPVAVNLGAWTEVARKEGKPLYIGEYSAMPMARTEAHKKQWDENPDWFDSYQGADSAKAEKIVATALNQVVDAKPNLVHWWCYRSSRDMDQKNPQRFDIDLDRTPNLVRMVAEANRRLQMETMGFTYVTLPRSK